MIKNRKHIFDFENYAKEKRIKKLLSKYLGWLKLFCVIFCLYSFLFRPVPIFTTDNHFQINI